MQSVHKIPTIIVLSFLIHANKKESLKYIVLNRVTHAQILFLNHLTKNRYSIENSDGNLHW